MVYNNKYIYLLLYTMPLKTPFELEIVNDLNDHDLNDHEFVASNLSQSPPSV